MPLAPRLWLPTTAVAALAVGSGAMLMPALAPNHPAPPAAPVPAAAPAATSVAAGGTVTGAHIAAMGFAPAREQAARLITDGAAAPPPAERQVVAELRAVIERACASGKLRSAVCRAD